MAFTKQTMGLNYDIYKTLGFNNQKWGLNHDNIWILWFSFLNAWFRQPNPEHLSDVWDTLELFFGVM